MDPGPDVEAHHRHTGLRWLDTALAVSAIVISLVSVVLAFQHGAAMEKMVDQNARMVQASTWPYLTLADSNGDAQGRRIYRLQLINNGVGPAKIEQIAYAYRGRAYPDLLALASAVGKDFGASGSVQISDTGGVVPARQSISLLTAEPPTTPEALIEALRGRGRAQIRVSVCYCSIFDECWRTDNDRSQPQQVEQCATSDASPGAGRDR